MVINIHKIVKQHLESVAIRIQGRIQNAEGPSEPLDSHVWSHLKQLSKGSICLQSPPKLSFLSKPNFCLELGDAIFETCASSPLANKDSTQWTKSLFILNPNLFPPAHLKTFTLWGSFNSKKTWLMPFIPSPTPAGVLIAPTELLGIGQLMPLVPLKAKPTSCLIYGEDAKRGMSSVSGNSDLPGEVIPGALALCFLRSKSVIWEKPVTRQEYHCVTEGNSESFDSKQTHRRGMSSPLGISLGTHLLTAQSQGATPSALWGLCVPSYRPQVDTDLFFHECLSSGPWPFYHQGQV